MATVARIKLSPPPKIRAEFVLTAQRGFRVVERTSEYLIVQKDSSWKPARTPDDLSDEEQRVLIKRCNNICDFYKYPEQNKSTIRLRLENMAKTMSYPHDEFIRNWSFNNVC